MDSALAWFESYLTDRYQCVYIKRQHSHKQQLPFGVPQGSVFRPFLFTLDTNPLSPIVSASGLKYHLLPDDTQLYISFKPFSKLSESYALKSFKKCGLQRIIWNVMVAKQNCSNSLKTINAPSSILSSIWILSCHPIKCEVLEPSLTTYHGPWGIYEYKMQICLRQSAEYYSGSEIAYNNDCQN